MNRLGLRCQVDQPESPASSSPSALKALVGTWSQQEAITFEAAIGKRNRQELRQFRAVDSVAVTPIGLETAGDHWITASYLERGALLFRLAPPFEPVPGQRAMGRKCQEQSLTEPR